MLFAENQIFYYFKSDIIKLIVPPIIFSSSGLTIFPHPVGPARRFSPLVNIPVGTPNAAAPLPNAIPVLMHVIATSPSYVKVLSGLTYEIQGLKLIEVECIYPSNLSRYCFVQMIDLQKKIE